MDLVTRLGDAAVKEFLEGLKPHFQTLRDGGQLDTRELGWYLHECAVSATVLLEAGGQESLLSAQAGDDEALPVEDAIQRVSSRIT